MLIFLSRLRFLAASLLLTTPYWAASAASRSNDGAIINADIKPLAEHANLPTGSIYLDPKAAPEARAEDAVSRMTLDEKLALTGGTGGSHFPGVPRLGLRTVHMLDASQGVCVHHEPPSLAATEKSTAFPCTLMLAATWDPDLAAEYATAIGEECRANYVDILLGPGMNIYRHSEGGRNFEYFGEDPFLSSRFAVSYVTAIQKLKVIATIKHFIANDQEFIRHWANAAVGERALHEICLPPFTASIVEADAGAVITSNNEVNGWPGAADQPLVQDYLRDKLGFRGMVMSDFASCLFWPERRNLILSSGLSLMMSTNDLFVIFFRDLIAKHPDQKDEAVRQLDVMVKENLFPLFKFGVYDRGPQDPAYLKNYPAHKEVACRTAEEGITLLKNDGSILPLDPAKVESILVVGKKNALTAYHGFGSGAVQGYDLVDYPAA